MSDHDHESTIPEADKLTDPSDQASEIEHRSLAIYLHDARKKAKRTQEARADGTYAITDCEDCGDEIGEGRLKVSIKNTICVYCATARERGIRR